MLQAGLFIEFFLTPVLSASKGLQLSLTKILEKSKKREVHFSLEVINNALLAISIIFVLIFHLIVLLSSYLRMWGT